MSRADWTVVIAVKRLSAAKSRLRGAVLDARHEELALAMVRDTVSAATACPRVAEVLVVTDDRAAAAAVAALGARAVPDRPDAGLNAALSFGADLVTGPSRRRAALAGDLPALRAGELEEALTAAGAGRAFVADAAGTGTVLLAAGGGEPLDPRFGVGSAAAHAATGARPLTGQWPGLSHDVDTAGDLRTALALGVGEHTCALLRDLGLVAHCAAGGVPAGPYR